VLGNVKFTQPITVLNNPCQAKRQRFVEKFNAFLADQFTNATVRAAMKNSGEILERVGVRVGANKQTN
jgi:hypothetical protein